MSGVPPRPEPWEWALLLPCAVALWLLGRSLAPEGPDLPRARLSVFHLVFVMLLHLLLVSALQGLLELPFLPQAWATGLAVLLAHGFTCLAILAVAALTGNPADALGLRLPRRPRNAAAVALGTAAFIIPCGLAHWAWLELLVALGRKPGPQPVLVTYLEARGRGDWEGVALMAAGAALAAPVFEELLFRGFLFGMLRAMVSSGLAVVIASAAFAVYHVQPEVYLPIFLVGLALNLVYVRTRCLAYPILFHALFNASTLVR